MNGKPIRVLGITNGVPHIHPDDAKTLTAEEMVRFIQTFQNTSHMRVDHGDTPQETDSDNEV